MLVIRVSGSQGFLVLGQARGADLAKPQDIARQAYKSLMRERRSHCANALITKAWCMVFREFHGFQNFMKIMNIHMNQ
ncbi:hypothetical protein [Delftia tsuruhatensis]|uniref:hypothetical protein n=1 Tax=Delftia tsuruhatensis TaxID=180282 RepID=UPI001F3AA4E2|nr:hypothetical protein [Delftia tsuruhatensis]